MSGCIFLAQPGFCADTKAKDTKAPPEQESPPLQVYELHHPNQDEEVVTLTAAPSEDAAKNGEGHEITFVPTPDHLNPWLRRSPEAEAIYKESEIKGIRLAIREYLASLREFRAEADGEIRRTTDPTARAQIESEIKSKAKDYTRLAMSDISDTKSGFTFEDDKGKTVGIFHRGQFLFHVVLKSTPDGMRRSFFYSSDEIVLAEEWQGVVADLLYHEGHGYTHFEVEAIKGSYSYLVQDDFNWLIEQSEENLERMLNDDFKFDIESNPLKIKGVDYQTDVIPTFFSPRWIWMHFHTLWETTSGKDTTFGIFFTGLQTGWIAFLKFNAGLGPTMSEKGLLAGAIYGACFSPLAKAWRKATSRDIRYGPWPRRILKTANTTLFNLIFLMATNPQGLESISPFSWAGLLALGQFVAGIAVKRTVSMFTGAYAESARDSGRWRGLKKDIRIPLPFRRKPLTMDREITTNQAIDTFFTPLTVWHVTIINDLNKMFAHDPGGAITLSIASSVFLFLLHSPIYLIDLLKTGIDYHNKLYIENEKDKEKIVTLKKEIGKLQAIKGTQRDREKKMTERKIASLERQINREKEKRQHYERMTLEDLERVYKRNWIYRGARALRGFGQCLGALVNGVFGGTPAPPAETAPAPATPSVTAPK